MFKHLVTRLIEIGTRETLNMNRKTVNIYRTEYFAIAAGVWLSNDMANMQIGGVNISDSLSAY